MTSPPAPTTPDPPPVHPLIPVVGRKRRAAKDALRVGLLGLFFLGMLLALRHPWVREELLDVEHLRARLRGTGAGGWAAFVAVAGIINAAGVPRIWVSAVAGTVFGAALGSVTGLVATLLGATVDFYIARFLLRGVVKRRAPARMKRALASIERRGFRAILYIRFFPLANATVTSVLAGVSHVGYPAFLAATVLGFLPLTIALATLGSSAGKGSPLQLGLGLAVLFAMIAFEAWSRTRPGRREDPEEPAREEPAPAPGSTSR